MIYVGGGMRQFLRLSILVLAIVVFFPSLAISAEKDVLQALESVKAAVEDGVSYEKVAELLELSGIQVNAIKKGDTSDCFRVAVRRCHYWYRLGVKTWETMINNQEQRDIHAKRAKSEYWDDHMKVISLRIVENYDKLIKHAQEALPSKWEYGNAALDEARACPMK
jgi:hypothetical protein